MTASDPHSTSSETDDRHPVDLLAEEFSDRISAGENPQIGEYIAKYPEHADLIRSVFPSIAMVQRVSNRVEQQHRPDSGRAVPFGKHSIPESLGDFQLVREIGRGGMGVVYEAIQLSLKRHVALKVIGAIPSGSDKQLARFRREAEAAASLHHTHIVPVYGIGEEHGVQYYAMQLIDGVTLGEIVEYLRGDRRRSSDASKRATSQATFSTAGAVDLLIHSLTTSDQPLRSSAFDSTVTKPHTPAASAVPLTKDGLMKTEPSAIAAGSSVDVERANTPAASAYGSLENVSVTDDVPANLSRPRGQSYYRNVAQIISHVADALQYAHHQGVLHRDIKPSNLLLDRDGIVWVTDFGLARRVDCEGMTQTGEIVGTLRYMAPEQMRGQADQRTDVYSLGLTLFELLTLEKAIDQPENRLFHTGVSEAMTKMHSLFPEIPADLQTIAIKACAAQPEHRYQSAAAFEEDLRRFLEDRPILARRTTRIEHLYRWSRRNPAIATLSSATFALLLTVAALLAVFNQRLQTALNAISQQFDRAEINLHEKTAALATVEKERTRAEFNLELAIQAFDTVIANIASRGGSDSILRDLNEGDVITMADATLSDADVVLLETLLGFFDRFSAENAKDLRGKAAEARRRVGDIQHRLGQLSNAEQSYQLALDAIKEQSAREPDDTSLIFVQADILNDLLVIATKRGQMPVAMEYYHAARDLLEKSDAVRKTTDGRFALAKTHNNLAAIGSRFNFDLNRRLRGPLVNRTAKPLDESIAIMQRSRLEREANANAEALQLLQDLTAEFPDTVAYQVSFAQALRDEVRIARMTNDWKRAEESLSKAISIFEKLSETHPESGTFKYELASTLSISVSTRSNEISRFARSVKLCDELISMHPNVAEYRAFRGQTLDKLAMIQISNGQKLRAEDSLRLAIDIQQKLADQYPDVLLYQVNLFQSMLHLVELHVELKRPELAKQDIAAALARFEKIQGQSRLLGPLQPIISRLRDRQNAIENIPKE
ncbi:MAG: serine/threonine-protein kinase [Pirellulaceae bacterium]|nr:serine/threonine-protein kinase [Pirellulaceae bacterium]